MVLEKTLESPLDCKEIHPVHPKGNQSWIFIGRTDNEAEATILWPPDAKNWLIGKDLDAGKDWRQEEKGMTEDELVGWHHWLDARKFEQALEIGDGQESLVCCSPKWKWKFLSHARLFANPMDYTVYGVLQARIPEWVAIPFSRGSSQPRDWTQVSCMAGRFSISWDIRGACCSPLGHRVLDMTEGLNRTELKADYYPHFSSVSFSKSIHVCFFLKLNVCIIDRSVKQLETP